MASEVDICNLALGRLGDKASVSSIDPPEGSAQAEHCSRFYPIARDSLLEKYPWRFATRRVALALLDVDTWGWAFAYARPTEAIKVLSILPPNGDDNDDVQPFESEEGVIYTDQEDAICRYTVRVTDTNKFSPLFVDTLGWMLASHLAGPVIKGDSGVTMAKACLQAAMVALGDARASDANQRKVSPNKTPSWIKAR